jgi:hypothetical protein
MGARKLVTLSVAHVRRESNPQPPVLETGALPIELRTSSSGQGQNRTADTMIFSHVLYQLSYLALPRTKTRAAAAARAGGNIGLSANRVNLPPRNPAKSPRPRPRAERRRTNEFAKTNETAWTLQVACPRVVRGLLK